MKLLYVTHHRFFKTATRSKPLAKQMVQRGHEVTVLCVADQERFRITEHHEDGVCFVEIPDLLWGRLRSGWDPYSILRRLTYLRGKKFDLIHVFETRPATIYPVLSLCRKHPTPLVIDWVDWWGRGGLIYEQRPLWYQKIFGNMETYYEEHFRIRAHSTTVISHALAERAQKLGISPDTIYFIPGGAEPALFTPRDTHQARIKFNLPHAAFVLAFAALDVTSDTELVIKALSLVIKKHPETILIMMGNRPTGLDTLITKWGVAANFRHLGFIPYPQLPEALSASDIFLLPFPDKISNRGRWPNKIGDYMCMARPTITNPVGEMKILFEREPAGLLADETAENFAQKIIELKTNPDLCQKMGHHARQVAETQFHWNKIGDLVEQCYRDTVKRFFHERTQKHRY